MKRLSKVVESPSALDSLDNYAGEIPDNKYLVVLCQSRDSDILTESNFACALEQLGGESDDVVVFRFGHWACGWWEALCVVEGTDAEKKGREIYEAIQDYPVLDDSDFYEREAEAARDFWKYNFDPKDRIEYIRNHRNEFEFHNFKDLMAQVRGEYFGGYASELIG